MELSSNAIFWKKTRNAYVWSHLLTAPFWAIYNMLPFILYKDLHATAWQITMMIALKPAASIFSMYWSALIIKRRDRLLSNLNWAKILGLLPFFFFPFIDNVWLIILFSGIFIMLTRGAIPAWMEILKLNIPENSRQKIFSYVAAFSYLGGGIFPLAFGWLMDSQFQAWRWLFPLVAFISILGFFFQKKIPIPEDHTAPLKTPIPTATLAHSLLNPWKNVWELMRSRPDFRKFQIGFMLCGFGIMVWQPALPIFFIDVLNLSYKELALALSLCKGIGFVLSSPFWAQWMQKVNIYRFCVLVDVLFGLFAICLMAAQSHILWLYAAYITYGITQVGSELSWHLSGPIFAKDEDSTVFSSVNVLMVGLRGCVAPAFGTLLCAMTNSTVVLGFGCALCLLAGWQMAICSKKTSKQEEEEEASLGTAS